MAYFLLMFLAVAANPVPALPGPPQSLPVETITRGVDRSFARMEDFSADFTQILQDSLNRRRQESGHLYLKRSRMMRWEYKNPEEKQFVSDGKTVYYYVPADRQVTREKVGDVVDERMPMMFLLGRSGLRNEFEKFERLPKTPEGNEVIKMFPKKKGDIQEIIMDVDPQNFLVHRLALTYSDASRSEFIFTNIRINTGLDKSLFDFKVPSGVKILEGIAP